MTVAVELRNVHKKFRIKYDDSTIFGAVKNFFSLKNNYKTIHSLNNINLQINQGDILGVIGANGAGKTTLLHIISKILKPSSGEVFVNGKVLPIIDFGSDLNFELTGKENVFLSGAILGFKKNYIKKKFAEIVAFSGLKDFINVKTKYYSSGMRMRLSFSIMLLANPDIVLIDEVFGVGDLNFRTKCLKKLDEYRNLKKTVVFVSQDYSFIKKFCNKCLFMDKGLLVYSGNPDIVVDKYLESLRNKEVVSSIAHQDFDDGKINSFEILNASGKKSNVFRHGETITFKINYSLKNISIKSMFGLSISSSDGSLITGPNTVFSNRVSGKQKKEGNLYFSIPSNPFIAGEYFVTIAIYDYNERIHYDSHVKRYSFRIIKGNTKEKYGVISIPHEWRFK